jgi:hypothetical protein
MRKRGVPSQKKGVYRIDTVNRIAEEDISSRREDTGDSSLHERENVKEDSYQKREGVGQNSLYGRQNKEAEFPA